jgi:response regulator of citrate/malate metabolism
MSSSVHRAPAWRVLVLDADPAALDRSTSVISDMGRFDVVATVTSGEQAVKVLRRVPYDLLLIDVELDDIDGMALLHWVRQHDNTAEILVHSALGQAEVIRRAFNAGAYDYVVKPNRADRLRQALAMFLSRASALAGAHVDQSTIDRAFAAGRQAHRWLPRGLSHDGARSVDGELARGREVSAAEVAEITGLSRVTARRYLEYFVASGQASVRLAGHGPGRPSKLYRII